MNSRIVPLSLVALLMIAAGPRTAPAQPSDSAAPRAFEINGDVPDTHDPPIEKNAVAKNGDTWHLFAAATGNLQPLKIFRSHKP
jgi:hypothetical protein